MLSGGGLLEVGRLECLPVWHLADDYGARSEVNKIETLSYLRFQTFNPFICFLHLVIFII